MSNTTTIDTRFSFYWSRRQTQNPFSTSKPTHFFCNLWICFLNAFNKKIHTHTSEDGAIVSCAHSCHTNTTLDYYYYTHRRKQKSHLYPVNKLQSTKRNTYSHTQTKPARCYTSTSTYVSTRYSKKSACTSTKSPISPTQNSLYNS